MANIDVLKTERMFDSNMVYTGKAIRAALEHVVLTGDYPPAVPARFYDGTEPQEPEKPAQDKPNVCGCKQEAGGMNPFPAFMAGVLMGVFSGMGNNQ